MKNSCLFQSIDFKEPITKFKMYHEKKLTIMLHTEKTL